MNENQNREEYHPDDIPTEDIAENECGDQVAEIPGISEDASVPTDGNDAIQETEDASSQELCEEGTLSVEQDQALEAPVYRWTYADQRAHDNGLQQQHGHKGWLVYALVMTGVFALSFGLLLGVLFMKGDDLPTLNISDGILDENDVADRESIAPVEFAKRSVVVIEVSSASSSGSGTGIILSSDGYIATNHHVIENGGNIRVRFYDGTYAEAVIKGSSEVDDLAVLKVNRKGLIPATFAKSSHCYVGETVYAIGNPGGPDFAWTTTRGIVSYVDREVKIYDDAGIMKKKLKLLQTDAMVNPGNSGGPLVNTKGEVVGVVSMKLADGYEGIGFAIPSDGAVEILNAIIRDGNADSVNSNISYDRPIIGITGVYVEGGKHYVMTADRIKEVDESYAERYPQMTISPQVSGIYVSGVTQGMDAADKLKVGDIITAVNGVVATGMSSLMNEINEHYAGDEVQVSYYRDGESGEVTIILGSDKK